jgi:release factor glutamine methyltransferase
VSQALSDLIADATATLSRAGVPSPEADAWHLASHVLGVSRGELHARMIVGSLDLTPEHRDEFSAVLSRRAGREPLWHITGEAPFLDMDLRVGPGVFTPRPETELLAHHAIEEALSLHPADGTLRVVDLCAGSGALALALARALPHAEVLAIEASTEAEPFLRDNTARYSPSMEIAIGDIALLASHEWAGSVDLIVTNPPYLRLDEPLDHETAGFDPEMALVSGEDGLDLIRRLIPLAYNSLRAGGLIVMEHGVDQGTEVCELYGQAGFKNQTTVSDLVGRDRFSRALKLA